MNICQEHWDLLRAAIDERGLGGFVSTGAEGAMKATVEEAEGQKITIDNFDPLMRAYWALSTNIMRVVRDSGGDPLYLLAGPPGETPEDPVTGYPGHEGKTWPRCGLCYVNLAHEVSCQGCDLDQERGFDFFIGKAADEQLEFYERNLAP